MSTNPVLELLHELLAGELADRVKQGEVDPETGERIPATASLLNVARQFLKDNGITGAIDKSKPLKSLTQALPFSSHDDHGIRN